MKDKKMSIHWSMAEMELGDLAGKPELFGLAFGETLTAELEPPIDLDTHLKDSNSESYCLISRYSDPELVAA